MKLFATSLLVIVPLSILIGFAIAPNRVDTGQAADARALRGHCSFERIQADQLRRGIWNRQRSVYAINFSYRDIAFQQFEASRICMQKENQDPVFFPQFCSVTETEVDIPCVLNQLDMLLLVMR